MNPENSEKQKGRFDQDDVFKCLPSSSMSSRPFDFSSFKIRKIKNANNTSQQPHEARTPSCSTPSHYARTVQASGAPAPSGSADNVFLNERHFFWQLSKLEYGSIEFVQQFKTEERSYMHNSDVKTRFIRSATEKIQQLHGPILYDNGIGGARSLDFMDFNNLSEHIDISQIVTPWNSYTQSSIESRPIYELLEDFHAQRGVQSLSVYTKTAVKSFRLPNFVINYCVFGKIEEWFLRRTQVKNADDVVKSHSERKADADTFLGTFSKMRKFFWISMADSISKLRITRCSLCYYVVQGAITVYVAPARQQDLKNKPFARNELKTLERVEVGQGQTLMIPAGWKYVAFTQEDSIVLGGHFLLAKDIPSHLKTLNLMLEKKLQLWANKRRNEMFALSVNLEALQSEIVTLNNIAYRYIENLRFIVKQDGVAQTVIDEAHALCELVPEESKEGEEYTIEQKRECLSMLEGSLAYVTPRKYREMPGTSSQKPEEEGYGEDEGERILKTSAGEKKIRKSRKGCKYDTMQHLRLDAQLPFTRSRPAPDHFNTARPYNKSVKWHQCRNKKGGPPKNDPRQERYKPEEFSDTAGEVRDVRVATPSADEMESEEGSLNFRGVEDNNDEWGCKKKRKLASRPTTSARAPIVSFVDEDFDTPSVNENPKLDEHAQDDLQDAVDENTLAVLDAPNEPIPEVDWMEDEEQRSPTPSQKDDCMDAGESDSENEGRQNEEDPFAKTIFIHPTRYYWQGTPATCLEYQTIRGEESSRIRVPDHRHTADSFKQQQTEDLPGPIHRAQDPASCLLLVENFPEDESSNEDDLDVFQEEHARKLAKESTQKEPSSSSNTSEVMGAKPSASHQKPKTQKLSLPTSVRQTNFLTIAVEDRRCSLPYSEVTSSSNASPEGGGSRKDSGSGLPFTKQNASTETSLESATAHVLDSHQKDSTLDGFMEVDQDIEGHSVAPPTSQAKDASDAIPVSSSIGVPDEYAAISANQSVPREVSSGRVAQIDADVALHLKDIIDKVVAADAQRRAPSSSQSTLFPQVGNLQEFCDGIACLQVGSSEFCRFFCLNRHLFDKRDVHINLHRSEVPGFSAKLLKCCTKFVTPSGVRISRQLISIILGKIRVVDPIRVDVFNSTLQQATKPVWTTKILPLLSERKNRDVLSFTIKELPDLVYDKIALPEFITENSIIHKLWTAMTPQHPVGPWKNLQIELRNQQKFLQIFMAGSFANARMTSFSEFHHVIEGSQEYYLAPNSYQDTLIYQRCMRNSDSLLCEFIPQFKRVVIKEDQSIVIPAGWIYAVRTCRDSYVFGSHFLTSEDLKTRLQYSKIHQDKPFDDILWAYMDLVLPQELQEGLQDQTLLEFAKEFLNIGHQKEDLKESIFSFEDTERIQMTLAEIIDGLKGAKPEASAGQDHDQHMKTNSSNIGTLRTTSNPPTTLEPEKRTWDTRKEIEKHPDSRDNSAGDKYQEEEMSNVQESTQLKDPQVQDMTLNEDLSIIRRDNADVTTSQDTVTSSLSPRSSGSKLISASSPTPVQSSYQLVPTSSPIPHDVKMDSPLVPLPSTSVQSARNSQTDGSTHFNARSNGAEPQKLSDTGTRAVSADKDLASIQHVKSNVTTTHAPVSPSSYPTPNDDETNAPVQASSPTPMRSSPKPTDLANSAPVAPIGNEVADVPFDGSPSLIEGIEGELLNVMCGTENISIALESLLYQYLLAQSQDLDNITPEPVAPISSPIPHYDQMMAPLESAHAISCPVALTEITDGSLQELPSTHHDDSRPPQVVYVDGELVLIGQLTVNDNEGGNSLPHMPPNSFISHFAEWAENQPVSQFPDDQSITMEVTSDATISAPVASKPSVPPQEPTVARGVVEEAKSAKYSRSQSRPFSRRSNERISRHQNALVDEMADSDDGQDLQIHHVNATAPQLLQNHPGSFQPKASQGIVEQLKKSSKPSASLKAPNELSACKAQDLKRQRTLSESEDNMPSSVEVVPAKTSKHHSSMSSKPATSLKDAPASVEKKTEKVVAQQPVVEKDNQSIAPTAEQDQKPQDPSPHPIVIDNPEVPDPEPLVLATNSAPNLAALLDGVISNWR